MKTVVRWLKSLHRRHDTPIRRRARPRLEALETRLTPAGDPDGAFSGDGIVTTELGFLNDEARSVAVQPDGKIVAAGIAGTSLALVRYNADGTPDNSFSGDGEVLVALGVGAEGANSLVVQPDGKIIAAGATATGFALVRHNADGTPDNSFSSDGQVITAFPGFTTSQARSVVLQPDGKLLLAGFASNASLNSDFAIARYNTNGTPDATFGTAGLVTTTFGASTIDEARAVVLQPDGKFLVVGRSRTASNNDFALARYTTGGLLDTTFGTDGLVTLDLGGSDEEAYTVGVQPDGRIVVAGRGNAIPAGFRMLRFHTDGALDATFGDGGVVALPGFSEARGLVALPHGKIVVTALTATADIAVARFNPDGSPDDTFSDDGVVTTDAPGTCNAYAVALQPNGRVVVAGSSLNAGNSDFMVVRYLSYFAPSVVVGAMADVAVSEDAASTTIDLADYFRDPEFAVNDLTFTTTVVTTTPGVFTRTVGANDVLTLDYQADAFGTVAVTVRATNPGLEFVEDTFVVTVAPVADAPVAADDAVTVAEDGFVAIDVTANDTDADGDDLRVTQITAAPVHGTAVLLGSAVVYTPDADYSGSDTFTYSLSDGNGGTDTATVTVTMTAVNDAPQADDGAATVDEDGSVLIDLTALVGDAETAATALLYEVGPVGQGTLTPLEGDGNEGKYTYTPDADYGGPDFFTFSVSDGELSSPDRVVSLTVVGVIDPPAAGDDTVTVAEDGSVVIDVTANDTDADGEPLAVTQVAAAPAHGTAVISGTQVVYTPAPNYSGDDSFEYQVRDAAGVTSQATVFVTVTPVSDAPVAADDSFAVGQNGAFVAPAPGLLGNDSDADGTALSLTAVNGAAFTPGVPLTLPSGARLTLNATGGYSYDPADAFDLLRNGQTALDLFTYTVSDGAATATARVTVTVLGANDAPAAQAGGGSVPEDGVLFDLLTATDADGDPLTYSLFTAPTHGSATVRGNGLITYTPAPGYSGTDSLTFRVTDTSGVSSTAAYAITIDAVNDAPTAVADALFVVENSPPVTADVLANDSDPDGPGLTITGRTDGAHGTVAIAADGKSVTYAPAAGYSGPDSFTYTVSDGTSSRTAAVSVSVVTVNDPPVAAGGTLSTSEDTPKAGTLAATDADSATLVYSVVSPPAHGTVVITNSITGAYTYTPEANYSGPDGFTFLASDGEAFSAPAAVSLTVTEVADAPVIGGTAANQAVSDTATLTPFAGVTVSDVDSSPLTATVTLSAAANGRFTDESLAASGFAAGVSGVYTFSGSPAALTAALRQLTFRPTENQVTPGGSVTTRFTLAVSDGIGSATDDATTVIATSMPGVSALPFADGFNRVNAVTLGGEWAGVGIGVSGGKAARTASRAAVATLAGLTVADVVAEADVAVGAVQATRFAGLVARHQSDRDYYAGGIQVAKGRFTAQILGMVNGRLTTLATAKLTAGTGRLRFEAVGESLKLFLNDALVAFAHNGALPSGRVGLRAAGAVTLDAFTAEALSPVVASLPYPANGFSSAVRGQLGPEWTTFAGNVKVANGVATLNAALAALNGVSAENVGVSARASVAGGARASAGVVARVNEDGTSYYEAALTRTKTGASVALFKVVDGVRRQIGTAKPVATSGVLGLTLSGSTLTVSFTGMVSFSVTDASITAAGSVGMKGSGGGTVDDFAAA